MSEASRDVFVHRERCPLCCSADGNVEVDRPFSTGAIGQWVRRYYKIDPTLLSGAPYRLVRCPRCTLLYQAWVGNAELLADLYGEWINDANHPDADPDYREIMAHPLESRDAHEILATAAFLGRKPAELTTLDYGMGWAMWGRIAHRLGCRSYGTELSPARATFAREHGVECYSDAEIPERSFDFINTEQVMEHLPNLRETADRLAAALRPGGILKISVPSAETLGPLLRTLRSGERVPRDEEIMPVQPLEHVNSFTSKALSVLANELGLRTVRPTIPQRYAFLRVRGGVSAARPRNAAKELARPFYQWRNPRNLYVWMQKPVATAAVGRRQVVG